MASVYLCGVIGDGLSAATAYRPDVTGSIFACLMTDTSAKKKALIVSSSDALTGTGVTKVLTAASFSALVSFAKANNPTSTQRAALASWLLAAGYTALTAGQVTWWDCLHYIAQQVNPAADLAATTC